MPHGFRANSEEAARSTCGAVRPCLSWQGSLAFAGGPLQI